MGVPAAPTETRKMPSPVPSWPPLTSRSPSGAAATARTWSSSRVVVPVFRSTTFSRFSGDGASAWVPSGAEWTSRSPRKATWASLAASTTCFSALPRVCTTTVDFLVAGSYSFHAIRVSERAASKCHSEASGAA